MKERQMSRIVSGKRYDTQTAELVAHDAFWDGHNFERSGRNQYLYRTPKGAFFLVTLSQWQGERDTLEPVTQAGAISLYEGPLTEHEMSYEAAFPGVTVTEPEAPATARPYPTPGRGVCLGWLKLDRPGDLGPGQAVCLACGGDLEGAAWLAAMATGDSGAELAGPYCAGCAVTSD